MMVQHLIWANEKVDPLRCKSQYKSFCFSFKCCYWSKTLLIPLGILHYFRKYAMDSMSEYLFLIDGDAHLNNTNVLQLLLKDAVNMNLYIFTIKIENFLRFVIESCSKSEYIV